MPAAVYADEYRFAEYLTLVVGRDVLGDLCGEASEALQLVVQDALLDYGVLDITAATDLRKLRIYGRWRVWYWVAAQYVTQYRFVVDSTTEERQQLFDHAIKMRDAAKAEVDRMLELEVLAAEADGGFDVAEQVLTPFNARERWDDERLRRGY